MKKYTLNWCKHSTDYIKDIKVKKIQWFKYFICPKCWYLNSNFTKIDF